MLSHVTIGSNDLPRAIKFYDALLATLGIVRYETDLEHGLAGYAFAPATTPQFWVLRPINGAPASVGNGVTVAFEAPNRGIVDAFHAAGLRAGAIDEGRPECDRTIIPTTTALIYGTLRATRSAALVISGRDSIKMRHGFRVACRMTARFMRSTGSSRHATRADPPA